MSTHKSQIETKQNTPVSSKPFVSAWGEKKKQLKTNSKPVQKNPPKAFEPTLKKRLNVGLHLVGNLVQRSGMKMQSTEKKLRMI